METRGITIEFYGKTIQLEDSIKDINKGLRATRDELKSINKDLKLDPTNVDRLKDKFAKLKQQQELLNKSIDLYEKELSKLGKEDIGSEKYVQLQTRLEGAKRSLQTVNDQLSKMEKMNLDNLSNGIETADNSLKNASNSALSFGDILKANVISSAVIDGLKTLANELKEVADELNEWAGDFRKAQVYEKQFENNIRNTADATDDEIKALKQLAKQKEKQGVISKKSLMSAFQELATYVESTDAIEGLTNALADMSAQQYGVDATEESVRNIATTLGKALANGDYSGLTRLGYGFDEAQKKIMKYGDELDRVAVLNDVIESSIGGMNEALAQTDAGKLFEVKSYFDDIKESIGEVVSELEIGLVEELMPYIQPLIDNVLAWIIDHKDEMMELVQNVVEWLTSEETQNFFQDVYELIGHLIDVGKELLKIVDDLGLIKLAIDLVKLAVDALNEALSIAVSLIRKIREFWSDSANFENGAWMGGQYVSFGSGGYGALNSGGFSSAGITVYANPVFNVNANNVTRADVEQWSAWMVDSINVQLGEAI